MARTAHDVSTTNGDWAVQAADTIEGVVTTVRDKTVVPLTTVARALVYGLLAAFVGAVALVLVVVLLARLSHDLLDELWDRPTAVWVGYLGTGIILALPGFLLLRRANRTRKAR